MQQSGKFYKFCCFFQTSRQYRRGQSGSEVSGDIAPMQRRIFLRQVRWADMLAALNDLKLTIATVAYGEMMIARGVNWKASSAGFCTPSNLCVVFMLGTDAFVRCAVHRTDTVATDKQRTQ